MKLDLNDKVLKFLRQRECSSLTIDVEDIPTPCCLGRVPDIKVSYDSPVDPDGYRHFFVQGIHVYISRIMRTREILSFYMTGFGPFKNIGVGGVNLVI